MSSVQIVADPLSVADVRELARRPDLVKIRMATSQSAALQLRQTAQTLHVLGHIIGDGRVSGSSRRGNGDDEQVGVGVLGQIAADLLEASGAHLCGTNHYAGAALLRQVVEVEYLTWAFAHGERAANEWLNSDKQSRTRFFTPGRLRQLNPTAFLSKDYADHCEQGGHPVPRAIPLLGNSDMATAQILMGDLLMHSWRSTDNLLRWSSASKAMNEVSDGFRQAQQQFAVWGREDPLYAWVLSGQPSPPPKSDQ